MNNQDRILLAHGDGGILTHKLIQELFHKYFTFPDLAQLTDATWVTGADSLALTTDSFVVSPLFFPGGDIGKLAVTGTVNDLTVSGAEPKYLTTAFILEEGLELATLERVVASMAATAEAAGVSIVTGDTKVVERGRGDGIYINTTGVGLKNSLHSLGYHNIQPGDQILINGTVGDHGTTIMAQRANITFSDGLTSDCTPLNGLISGLMSTFGPALKFMRDPTRGGVATTIKEIALATGLDLRLQEAAIPVHPATRGLTELLGLDPLYLANEGKVIIIAAPDQTPIILDFMRQRPEGQAAALIGEVRLGNGKVLLQTPLGGTRLIDMLYGTPLPRIC